MNVFIEIAISLFSGLFCVFLGWLLNERHRIPSWLALNNHDNWHGIWLCRWSPKKPNDDGWITEKVSLTHRFGQLKIDVVEPGDEYDWEAAVTLKRGYLVGEWKSKKLHSTSFGTVQLKTSNQGNSMFGYFTGTHVNGRMTIYRFIVAENEAELERVTRDFKRLL